MNLTELEKFYKGKSVLVTGHTGFKGSWLIRILTLSGAKVTGYSLNPPTDPSLFQIAGLEKTVNSVIGDIRDLEGLKKVFHQAKPEIVFHLAAQPIVRLSLIHIYFFWPAPILEGRSFGCRCRIKKRPLPFRQEEPWLRP